MINNDGNNNSTFDPQNVHTRMDIFSHHTLHENVINYEYKFSFRLHYVTHTKLHQYKV